MREASAAGARLVQFPEGAITYPSKYAVAGGVRLFEDGFPSTSWSLTNVNTTDTGAIVLVYDRLR